MAAVLVVVLLIVVAVVTVLRTTITFGPIPQPSNYGLNVVLSKNGTVAYVSEPSQNRVLAVETRTGEVTARIKVGITPAGLAVSPSGKQVWVVDTDVPVLNGAISVISTSSDKLIRTIELPIGGTYGEGHFGFFGGGAIDIAFAPSGKTAYVTINGFAGRGAVDVISTSTLSVTGTLGPPRAVRAWHPTSVSVNPDGREVWVSETSTVGAGPDDQVDSVFVFAAATGALRARIPVGQGPFFMALSHDGRYAYLADKQSCDVKEIDTAALRVVATLAVSPADGCPFGIAAAEDDRSAYFVTGDDHTVDIGVAGNTLATADFATSRITDTHDIGVDPITVATLPGHNVAYVVDANRPAIYLVNPTTGADLTTWNLLGTHDLR